MIIQIRVIIVIELCEEPNEESFRGEIRDVFFK